MDNVIIKEETLIRHILIERMTTTQLMKKYDVGYYDLVERLKRHGLYRESLDDFTAKNVNPVGIDIILREINNGLSQSEIAKKYNCSRQNVCNKIRAYNKKQQKRIEKAKEIERKGVNTVICTTVASKKDDIAKEFITTDITYEQLAEKYQCGVPNIKTIIKRSSLASDAALVAKAKNHKKVIERTEVKRRELIRAYLKSGKASPELAEEYKVRKVVAGLWVTQCLADILDKYENKGIEILRIADDYGVDPCDITNTLMRVGRYRGKKNKVQ